MKIVNMTELLVVGKAEPSKSRDGQNTYYRIACVQNGQACNLSVPQEVYDLIPDGQAKTFKFITTFDDKYNSFRVDGFYSQPEAKPAPAAAAK